MNFFIGLPVGECNDVGTTYILQSSFFFSADDDEITFDPDDIITDIEQVIAILWD